MSEQATVALGIEQVKKATKAAGEGLNVKKTC